MHKLHEMSSLSKKENVTHKGIEVLSLYDRNPSRSVGLLTLVLSI